MNPITKEQTDANMGPSAKKNLSCDQCSIHSRFSACRMSPKCLRRADSTHVGARKLKCSGASTGCQRCIRDQAQCHYSLQKPMGRPRKRQRELEPAGDAPTNEPAVLFQDIGIDRTAHNRVPSFNINHLAQFDGNWQTLTTTSSPATDLFNDFSFTREQTAAMELSDRLLTPIPSPFSSRAFPDYQPIPRRRQDSVDFAMLSAAPPSPKSAAESAGNRETPWMRKGWGWESGGGPTAPWPPFAPW